ncbi:MAG: HEPN domain-containing protein [Cyclobacteriaceae bacterium]|nr:HEPN domain-containing protein [Cyclobacteriaceae bacterium]
MDRKDYLEKHKYPNVEIRIEYDVNTILTFCLLTWLVKDNSINLNSYFLYNTSTKNYYNKIKYKSYCTCKGNYGDQIFTVGDLKRTLEFVKIFLQNFDLNDIIEDPEAARVSGIKDEGINLINYNKQNRIARALLFLDPVRITNKIPNKIAFYIGIFECLFSTSAGEVTHKVSERLAFYLGDSVETRKDLFRFMKRLYDTRSQLIHGQLLSKDSKTNEQLSGMSVMIDDIVRKVLVRAMTEDSHLFLNEKEFAKWHTDLIFNCDFKKGS